MSHLAIIADDLTGANDTGVQFAKQGIMTTVLFSETEIRESDLSGDVVVINTDSRALDPTEARRIVEKVSLQLRNLGVKNIFKKIDSTMRGNIGAEIDAVMDTYGIKIAIVAPAFPNNHRITKHGIHYVNGVPLGESEISKDPICPIRESYLPALLEKQSKREVILISIDDIRKGAEFLSDKMKTLSEEYPSVIAVFDAVEDRDLETISRAAGRMNERKLCVGSAGIAFHLSKMPESKDRTGEQRLLKRHPVLVVAGSVSSVTQKQIDELKKSHSISEIVISPDKFFDEHDKQLEVNRVIEEGKRLLEQGDLIFSTERDRSVIEKVKSIQKSLNLSSYFVGKEIADTIGYVASQLIAFQEVQGVILTGGDIAGVTCNLLKGKGIRVIGEVENGIPYGELFGGPYDGLSLVTKAGAFGSEKALVHAFDSLTGIGSKK